MDKRVPKSYIGFIILLIISPFILFVGGKVFHFDIGASLVNGWAVVAGGILLAIIIRLYHKRRERNSDK